MKPRIHPVSSPSKPANPASRYRSTPKQQPSAPIHPSPPPVQPAARPQTRSLGTDKGKAVISARLNSSMLAWEDKRGVEEPRKQVSYLLHQNKLLERVVVSLQTKAEKSGFSSNRPSVSRPRPPSDSKLPPTLQALQALITWSQRYVSTVSPYVTRPDVSVSLARDSLQAAIELAQASVRDWSKGKPQPKASYVEEETLVVRKKLLQYQAQKALEFAQCGGKSPFLMSQTLGETLSRTEESLNATREKISLGKTASVGSSPRALLEDERKTLEIAQKTQGAAPSASLSTVQSRESLSVDLNCLLQQKAAADSTVAALSLQLANAGETEKSLRSQLEKAVSELERQRVAIDSLQNTRISEWDQRKMQLEDCTAQIVRLEDHCKGLQMDLSTVLHDNSSLSRDSKPCNCAFTKAFPSDLLAELEQVLGSVKAQWREQLNLEDRLRLEITALEVENEGLRGCLKEGLGVRTDAAAPYSAAPFEGSVLSAELRTPREPVKACPAALQEIADFEERMKKRLETAKVPRMELLERSQGSNSEEYDSSALGRMDITEDAECSFGLEAASPIPPALSDRPNPLSTLHEVQQLVFAPNLKPSDLQTALRSLLSLPCAEGQLSPPLSPHRSPQLQMSFEGKPLVRHTDPLRSSLDSTGAPPSIRDAVLRILSEVKDPSLGGSIAALSAFFQLTEAEVQRAVEHPIRSD